MSSLHVLMSLMKKLTLNVTIVLKQRRTELCCPVTWRILELVLNRLALTPQPRLSSTRRENLSWPRLREILKKLTFLMKELWQHLDKNTTMECLSLESRLTQSIRTRQSLRKTRLVWRETLLRQEQVLKKPCAIEPTWRRTAR